MTYSVSGSYFESCNCDAICPCRMTDGVVGGRSTYGTCFGAMAWRIEDGHVGELDVSGLGVALLLRYDDHEPGSPWTIALRVDAPGDESQRAANDELGVHEDPFDWELSGNCAFASRFAYPSE